MSILERVILYAVLILSLVSVGQQYLQYQAVKELGEQRLNIVPGGSYPTTPTTVPRSAPPAVQESDTDKFGLIWQLTNLVPFKVIDAEIKEGDRTDAAICSDKSAVFSEGDEYQLLSAGGHGVYIQSEWTLRDWNKDFAAIREALDNAGYRQCTNEKDIEFPWPRIGYKNGTKGAWLMGTSPRGVEGSIELYLEK